MFPDVFGWLRTAGIAALVAGIVGIFAYAKGNADGRAYERAKQAAATQQQNQLGNEAADEVREMDPDCLAGFLAGRVPDGCP